MNDKRIWLQMRLWIEEQDDIRKLLPDPHSYADVYCLVAEYYPDGTRGFIYDITHTYTQRRNRDRSRAERACR